MTKWRYGTRVPDIKSRTWRCRNVKWIKLKQSFPRCAYLMTIGGSKLTNRAEQAGMHGRGSDPGFQPACKFSASKSASHHFIRHFKMWTAAVWDDRASRMRGPESRL